MARPRRRRKKDGSLPAYVKVAPHRCAARIARKDDVPRGFCRVCAQAVAATRGRVRSWHDGRALPDGGNEPNCLHAYKVATRPNYGRRIVAKRDGRKCNACGVTRGLSYSYLHLDHIVPLADGGTATEENLQLLCPDCHKEKTAREATERARRRREAKDAA